MQYNINIDMCAVFRWEINIQQAVVFAYIHTCPSWCTKDPNDGDWFNISNGKLATELGALSDKRDTMLRYVLQLVDAGVIERKSIDKKQFLKITGKGMSWNRQRDKHPDQPEGTGELSRTNGINIPQGTGQTSVESVNQLSVDQESEDGQGEKEERTKPKTRYEMLNRIAELFNENLAAHTPAELPQPFNYHRQDRIREIISERPDFKNLGMWEWYFSGINELPFWNGKDKENGFKRGLDYFLKPETMSQMIEAVEALETEAAQ